MCVLISEIKVFGEVIVNGEHVCASVWVTRKLLGFSLIAAVEHEAGRQTETGKVRPVNAAVSHPHEVKAKVVGGQLAMGWWETLWRCPGLGVLEVMSGGEAVAEPQDRVAVASIGCLSWAVLCV